MAAVIAELTLALKEKRFAAPDGALRTVLRDVAFTVASGAVVAMLGPSGCGKTTLLNILAGLDREFGGSLVIGGRIGYVFQQPRLLPWRTVFENVALAVPGAADPKAIAALIDEVGLGGHGEAYPQRLSLGMARRAAIARAFAAKPELLLMDEAFVSLDEATARHLRRLLLGMLRAHPTTVVLVTHDLKEAVELADRILVLSPAPGRLLGELAVPLPRDQREDEAALEAARAEIAAAQARLLASAG